jgi:hypothetical protein
VPVSRKSISSKEGIAPSTARSADAAVTPGPARSALSRNATSTSTPTATKRERGTASPLANTPEASMKASTGSVTPWRSCSATVVKPTL